MTRRQRKRKLERAHQHQRGVRLPLRGKVVEAKGIPLKDDSGKVIGEVVDIEATATGIEVGMRRVRRSKRTRDAS